MQAWQPDGQANSRRPSYTSYTSNSPRNLERTPAPNNKIHKISGLLPAFGSTELWAVLLTDWHLSLAWILPVCTWDDPTSADLEGVLQCGVHHFWNQRPDFTLVQHCYNWIEIVIWGSARSCLEQSAKGCSPWHFFLLVSLLLHVTGRIVPVGLSTY